MKTSVLMARCAGSGSGLREERCSMTGLLWMHSVDDINPALP